MFARRIITLSLLVTVISGYLYLIEHLPGFIWSLAISVLVAICAYIFQHQLNWWWYSKYPPTLAPQVQKMYMQTSEFYRTLSQQDRRTFDTRARLFVEAKEFIPQGFNDVAEDIKYMIAFYAVMVSMKKSDYLFDPYHRIVCYLHPFLSPNMPDQVHTYEIEHEDGTLIFSLEQLTASFFSPLKYHQTGLHAFAELFIQKFLSDRDDPQDSYWQLLEEIGPWSKQAIDDFTGMPSNLKATMIHHWFLYNEKIRQRYPELYAEVLGWLA